MFSVDSSLIKRNSNPQITFKVCDIGDTEEIMAFLRENYDPDHILAIDRNFLLYEHAWGSRLNFVKAINSRERTVEGVVGFNQYSSRLRGGHISSTTLSVRRHCEVPFIGIQLIRELKKLVGCESYCGVNTNKDRMVPYVSRFLKHMTGIFSHLYIPNPNYKNFKILSGNITFDNVKPKKSFFYTQLYELFDPRELYAMDCMGIKWKNIPLKSEEFLIRRYFMNPIFKYRFFRCKDRSRESFLVLKEERVCGSSICRVVDYIGDLYMLNSISFNLRELIVRENYEYCDLFSSTATFLLDGKHCFQSKDGNDVIVPHYFYPYIKKNITVYYETDSPENVYFKGHGDGDRPNLSLF